MNFKRRLKFEAGLKEIEIIPLINIVFILLIFLMLVSSFVIQPGMKVVLPRALTSEVIKHENAEITVFKNNTVYLNRQAVKLPELKSFLGQLYKRSGSVLIKADRAAALDTVVRIWDLCREEGIIQINIATDQE